MKQKHTVLYRLSLPQPLQSVSHVWSKGKLELEYHLFLSAPFVPARVSCCKPSPAFFLCGSIAFILLLFWNLSIKLMSPTMCRLLRHDGYHSPYDARRHGIGCFFWFLKTVQAQTHRGQAVTQLPNYPIIQLSCSIGCLGDLMTYPYCPWPAFCGRSGASSWDSQC